MRAAALAIAAAAVSAVTAANAVVPENGSIFFVGSRAENFYPEVYSVAADGSGRTNLTRNPAPDESPAISPDGQQIAFVSQRDGFAAVYVMNVDGSNQHRLVGRILTSQSTITAPAWSPTGRTLAFTVNQPPSGSLFWSSQNYLVDVASGRLRALGQEEVCGPGGASFSPDGRFVAYQMFPCRFGSAHVRVVRTGGGPERGVGAGGFAGWAPRGQRLLLLQATRKRGVHYVATVDPSRRHRWVLKGFPASAAAWSPSGRLIAFSRRLGRRPGVYVVRPGAHRPRRLVALANASSIVWSPDGAWLAVSTVHSPQASAATYFVRSNGHGLRSVPDRVPPNRKSLHLPVWSGNSRHFAVVGRDGTARVVTPPESAALVVTDAAVDTELLQIAWAGDRLVFASGGPRSTHLFAVEQDGTGVRQVTPDGAPVGRISPDGSRVAFVRASDIWTGRLDGSDERQLTSGAALDAEPAWSPDGRRIAFVRGDVFVVDSGGGEAQQLTRLTGPAYDPVWSPDGASIAFMSGSGLFAVLADGSGRRHLMSTVGLSVWGEPAWSPDGTKLALGGCAVGVVNADGSGYRQLTATAPRRQGQPIWSPDGTKIVFARSAIPCPGGTDFHDLADSDLWTINPDGSGERRLTDGPWPDTMPVWLPARP